MKKMMALILALVMALSLVACGGSSGGAGDDMALKDIADKLTEGLKEDEMPAMETVTLDEEIDAAIEMQPEGQDLDKDELKKDMFQSYLFIPSVDGAEVVIQEPMMGSFAHSAVLLRLPEGADVEAVRKDIEANANPRKWVCVEAEKVNVTAHGNTILLVMSDAKTADTMTANFDALWA